MTPIVEIGWVRHHRAALWWLGLLYRRPRQFIAELARQWPESNWEGAVLSLKLYFHLLPYMALLISVGRFFLFAVLDVPHKASSATTPTFVLHIVHGVSGMAIGIGAGLAVFALIDVMVVFYLLRGKAHATRGGTALGTTLGIPIGILLGVAFGIAWGVAHEIPYGVLVGISVCVSLDTLPIPDKKSVGSFLNDNAINIGVGIAIGIYFGEAFGIKRGVGLGYTRGIALGIAFAIAGCIFLFAVKLRAYYQLLFLWLSWPWPIARLYRLHPVAWDDLCGLPFPNLAGLLVAYGEREPQAADFELARLERDCPRQRRAALRARTILIARRSAEMKGFTELAPLLAGLPEGERGYLRQTKTLRERASTLAAQASRVETTTVPVLKAAEATQLCLKVREFRDQIAGFEDPLVSEFQEAARHWLKLAEQLQAQAQGLGERVTWPQVFQAGNRIEDRNREAFVRRDAVLDDLRQQLLLSTGCPGILLYGRRRVGKSTVITNLAGFLPDSVSVAFVSMQNPNLFQSLASFCQALGRAANQALPPSLRATGAEPSTLVSLWDMLHSLNEALGKESRQLLLAIDEYENLDLKIGEGVFPTDLLSGLRESLQSHRQIIWLFAGSHAVEELEHAPWSSCFVSSRTVEVGMFTSDETYVLLTDPMRHAPRALSAAAPNIHFPPESWGPGGIERIHREAGGWPHLVLLIAQALTDLVNRTGQGMVNDRTFEEALDMAIVRGDAVFVELLRKECRSTAESEYLAGFRTKDAQPAPPEDVLVPLRRRWLLEPDSELWRLRVPLMQRWLRARG